MKISLVIFLWFTASVSLQAQNQKVSNTNEALQARIARLETQSDSSLSEEFAALFYGLMDERDLLALKVQMLQTKVAVLEDKLTRSENQLAESEHHLEQLRKDLSVGSDEFNVVWDGYYVILDSERELNRAVQHKEYMMSKNAGLDLMIMPNPHGSWFYICVNQSLDLKQASEMAKKFQDQGFKDAWWIGVKHED